MRTNAAHSHPRRDFLAALGSTALAGAVPAASGDPGQAPGGLVEDTPRDLKPNGADLGSVLAEVEKLARDRSYESSFLTGRFRSLDDFLAHGRQKVFDALLHRPSPVPPAPRCWTAAIAAITSARRCSSPRRPTSASRRTS